MQKTHYRAVIRDLKTGKILYRDSFPDDTYEEVKNLMKSIMTFADQSSSICRIYRCTRYYMDLQGYLIRKRGSTYYAPRRAIYEYPKRHRIFARELGLL